MAEKQDNIFDLVDPEKKKPSNGWGLPVAFILIIFGFGATLFFSWSKITGKSTQSFSQNTAPAAGTLKMAGYDDYVNFAEHFYISAFNLSYSNNSDQIDNASKLMAPDLADYYKSDFLDTQFRQKILLRKMYITFQRVEHSQVDTVSGDQVVVRDSGDNYFNSDIDGSQIQLHLSMLISVIKKNDTYQVVNFLVRL